MVEKEQNESADKPKVITLGFNQTQECFACGTTNGFHIFTTVPFGHAFHRDLNSDIKIVEMFFRTNILLLVGGGSNPNYPPNKVIVWDDCEMKSIAELTFKTEVMAVRLRKDKIVVVLDNKIYLYNFFDLKLLDTIDTCSNPLGLCAIRTTGNLTIVSPSTTKGGILITHYDENISIEKVAHKSEITAIALSSDSRICATASKKGTLIRLFSTVNGELLRELRRGTEATQIHSLSFDLKTKWLACTSDKGTVHVFSIIHSTGAKVNAGKTINKKSALRFMKWVFGYFGSEWSFAKFRISDKDSIVAFVPGTLNQIMVISKSGKCYLAEFDQVKGGLCKLIASEDLF